MASTVLSRWRFTDGLGLGTGTIVALSGSGTPEGAVTAPVGSLYVRSDGGTSTTLYVKESGSGNTGWIAHGAPGGGGTPVAGQVIDYDVDTAVGAAATVNLDSGERPAKMLRAVEIFSTVPYKVAIHTVDNGTESTNPKGIGGALEGGHYRWDAPEVDYVVLGTTAGTDAFRVKFTNLDPNTGSITAYAVFYMEDV